MGFARGSSQSCTALPQTGLGEEDLTPLKNLEELGSPRSEPESLGGGRLGPCHGAWQRVVTEKDALYLGSGEGPVIDPHIGDSALQPTVVGVRLKSVVWTRGFRSEASCYRERCFVPGQRRGSGYRSAHRRLRPATNRCWGKIEIRCLDSRIPCR